MLKRTLPEMVEAAAERIRTAFAVRTFETDTGRMRCTVSAGFTFGSGKRMSFDKVLSAVDTALFATKRDGRNRVLDTRRCAWNLRAISGKVRFPSGTVKVLRLRPSMVPDYFVIGVEVDVKNLGYFAEQIILVVALRHQDVDRRHDIDALGQPPLLIVLDKTFHRLPLASFCWTHRPTITAGKARRACLRGPCGRSPRHPPSSRLIRKERDSPRPCKD